MSSQPSDFSLSALNVYINTEISGLFFQEAITPQLQDTSYQINVRVSTNSVNQLFLFHTSNTLGDTIESDLTDLSSSDFKYAFNVSQFENHIRAVCGLKKEKVNKIANAEMINILGKEIEDYRKRSFKSNEYFFDYEKKIVKEKRKMGHLTVLKK